MFQVHSWPNRTGVTLIGDAAHVMSPISGQGVNLAMWDAADLARAVLADDWRQAIAAHEPVMFDRAEQLTARSASALSHVMSADALHWIRARDKPEANNGQPV